MLLLKLMVSKERDKITGAIEVIKSKIIILLLLKIDYFG